MRFNYMTRTVIALVIVVALGALGAVAACAPTVTQDAASGDTRVVLFRG